MFTREDAEKLQRDYIPGGKHVSGWKDLKYRVADRYEIYQCGIISGYDPQSGSIYCGNVAKYLHFTNEDTIVALCGNYGHKPKVVPNED